jgi:stage V sporulation protein S
METLKVSAHTKTKALAGALAAVIRTEGIVELLAIGAGAVNQAIKAVAIARGSVAPNGINLIIIPSFVEIMIDGEERTAIKITVEPR